MSRSREVGKFLSRGGVGQSSDRSSLEIPTDHNESSADWHAKDLLEKRARMYHGLLRELSRIVEGVLQVVADRRIRARLEAFYLNRAISDSQSL